MPNWCYTNFKIKGKDAKKMYDWMKETMDNATYPTDFGSAWLGNFLLALNIAEEDVRNGSVACRGSITDINYINDTLEFSTETAWIPMIEVFRMIADNLGFDVDIDFYAEESGMEIYVATDYSMTEDCEYYVDVWCEDEDEEEDYYYLEGFHREDFLREEIKKIYPNLSFKEAINKAYDKGIYIHKIDLVDLDSYF